MAEQEPPVELIEVWEAVGVMVNALFHVLEQADEITRIVNEINEKLDKMLTVTQEKEWENG